MKFTVKKSEMEKAMVQIDTIVPGRDTQTLLSNVLILIENSNIKITASDMESTVRITLDAENCTNGELIVKARKLSEISRQINSDKIVFTAEDSEETDEKNDEKMYRIKLEGNGGKAARFRMSGFDRSHFPDLNEISREKLFQIPGDILTEMISKTFYSISQEDNRYIYNGLFFSSKGNRLTIVGTDGRRLAAITRELPKPVSIGNDENGDVVVHAKAIRELQKIMNVQNEVHFGIEQRDIFFRIENAELSSRLLEGKFPDYNKVIPGDATIWFDVDRDVLLNAIKQIMVMTEQPSHQVKMSITASKVVMMANTPDVGEAEIDLPVSVHGDELEIGFNANYFLDILKSISCSRVKLKFIDAARPIVFEDPDDKDFIALVMPMKI